MLVFIPPEQNRGAGLWIRLPGIVSSPFLKAGSVPCAILGDFRTKTALRAGSDATCKPVKQHQLQFAKIKLMTIPQWGTLKLIQRVKPNRHTGC
jgi:hypothetical protein